MILDRDRRSDAGWRWPRGSGCPPGSSCAAQPPSCRRLWMWSRRPARRRGSRSSPRSSAPRPRAGRSTWHLEPAALAATYACAGAAAISVLTEEALLPRLARRPAALRGEDCAGPGWRAPCCARISSWTPTSCWRRALAGADAVLLIAAILEDGPLAACLSEALDAGPDAAGRGARRSGSWRAPCASIRPWWGSTTATCAISPSTWRRRAACARCVPGRAAWSSRRAASTARQQMRELAALGVDAALVGEALVTRRRPGRAGCANSWRRDDDQRSRSAA